MLRPIVRKSFLDNFYHDIKDHILEETQTKVNLHILKIANNRFDIHPLLSELSNSIITFCLSKKEYQLYVDQLRFGELNKAAQEKFRDYQSNEGEFGELLLYCFLESHLEAPKLLTKMNLKTSHNDYVKGADGVHLLKVSENEYQVIFGESKMYKTLKVGLSKAFKSIDSFLNHTKNNVHYEMQLINSHLEQEIIDDQTYEQLRKIIFPSANEDEIQTNRAFGIFVGFNMEVSAEMKKLPNADFQKQVRQQVNSLVQKELGSITKLIEKYDLYGYSFYIYCIPFIEIDKVRKDAIKTLKGEVS
ncbi:HamA C-terminal domain-containing protein [Metabacillus hrfriensis]|uniref:DUF1837 domain-containing protein n=1 Tax=Metabacillus hrfriensis TaxID=3048891 RepID=A0ACD4RI88_9BACI|nr:DUF1837 domain-containing protein [Metabacillus sp. CT-WN-B3]WHZ60091.1 DUF1837 domain-containing protein [Metabacillus sp. CT-WN-B3]